MKRSRALVGVLAACSALALAACEKPAPGITVFSGTNSVHQEAVCWSFDETPVDIGECAVDVATGEDVRTEPLEIRPGATLGISVEPEVAEAGWTPNIDGQPLTSQPVDGTYFRFVLPDIGFSPGAFALEIVAGEAGQQRGLWAFALDAVQ